MYNPVLLFLSEREVRACQGTSLRGISLVTIRARQRRSLPPEHPLICGVVGPGSLSSSAKYVRLSY
jgi:hypothetical protein